MTDSAQCVGEVRLLWRRADPNDFNSEMIQVLQQLWFIRHFDHVGALVKLYEEWRDVPVVNAT